MVYTVSLILEGSSSVHIIILQYKKEIKQVGESVNREEKSAEGLRRKKETNKMKDGRLDK